MKIRKAVLIFHTMKASSIHKLDRISRAWGINSGKLKNPNIARNVNIKYVIALVVASLAVKFFVAKGTAEASGLTK
jgi:hypothetical protein